MSMGVLPMGLDHVGGAGDHLAVDGQPATGEHHHDDAEEQRVHGDPEQVAPDDRLLGLGAAGEVAEVPHERPVDRDPECAAAEDLAQHLPGPSANKPIANE
jgi:hypothetical protein